MAVSTPGTVLDTEYVGSWFSIDLKIAGQSVTGFFKEISGLGIEVEIVDVATVDATGRTRTRKRPGTAKYGEIVLKRTLTADKTFWNWAKSIRDGKLDFRTDGAVVLHDMSGAVTGRWTFINCWPSKWSASDLDVGSDDLMEEEITLQVEQVIREK
jgi:phage tail-like protein